MIFQDSCSCDIASPAKYRVENKKRTPLSVMSYAFIRVLV